MPFRVSSRQVCFQARRPETALRQHPELPEPAGPGQLRRLGKGVGNGSGAPVALTIIKALGGKANINTVENCITRLRVNLADPSLVDEELIKTTKPKGIVRKDNDVQIVYGLEVADVRRAVDEELEKMGSAT